MAVCGRCKNLITQSLNNQRQCAKHVSLCTKLWCVTPWTLIRKKKGRKRGDYLIEGYQLLSNCRHLSMVHGISCPSDQQKLRLIYHVWFIFNRLCLFQWNLAVVSHYMLCDAVLVFSIIWFAMPLLISPLTTAHLCQYLVNYLMS